MFLLLVQLPEYLTLLKICLALVVSVASEYLSCCSIKPVPVMDSDGTVGSTGTVLVSLQWRQYYYNYYYFKLHGRCEAHSQRMLRCMTDWQDHFLVDEADVLLQHSFVTIEINVALVSPSCFTSFWKKLVIRITTNQLEIIPPGTLCPYCSVWGW